MKATYAVILEEQTLALESEEIDPGDLAADELIIRAEASVVSAGTELANFLAISPGVHIPGSWNAYPWRPGYGLVGHVVAVDPDQTRFAPGDRVFSFGKHASLQRFEISGSEPHRAAYPIGEDVHFTRAMMARMTLVSMAGLQMAEISAGDRVVVFGLGVVGNIAAQLFRWSGARVLGLDPVSARCRIARTVGIEAVAEGEATAQVSAVRDWTGGEGVQIAVDASGLSAVIQVCVECCAPYGQVILLGSPRAAHQMDVTPMLRRIHHDWIKVVGALEWRLPPYPVHGYRHSIGSNLALALALIREGEIEVDPLVTHLIQPEELGAAYQGLWREKEEYLGVLIDWR